MSPGRPEPLTSLQNPRVKQLVKLQNARERRRSGLTRIDGGRELLRALAAGLRPRTVYLCQERLREGEPADAVARAEAAGVEVQPVDEAVYEKIRYGDRDEGLCAVAAWAPLALDALRPAEWDGPAFLLVVEGAEKPGNLGALLRTADGAGVHAVLLADPVCEPANPNVVRASMGTLFTQPVAVDSAEAIRDWLRRHGIAPVTTRPQATRLYTDEDLRVPLAVVMGSEHSGLSAGWDVAESHGVRLPMAGVSDSLNLAAATAAILYEVVRQRGGSNSRT